MPASGWAAVSAGSDILSGAVSKALWTRISPVTPRVITAYGCQPVISSVSPCGAEPLAADPGERVLKAVQQPRGGGEQHRPRAQPGPLGVGGEQQGEPDHDPDDQPVPQRVADGVAALRLPGHDERGDTAREQQEPGPALLAERLLGLVAGEREGEEQVGGEERFHQRDLAVAQRDRAEDHAAHHESDTAQPARDPDEVEQQAGERKSLSGACEAAFCWSTKPKPRQQAALTARTRTSTDTLGTSIHRESGRASGAYPADCSAMGRGPAPGSTENQAVDSVTFLAEGSDRSVTSAGRPCVRSTTTNVSPTSTLSIGS